MLSTTSITQDRVEYIKYSEPYLETTQTIVGHKKDCSSIRNISKLENDRIVVARGYWFKDKEKKEIYIKKINENTKYLNDIISGFFLLSKIENDKDILYKEDININEIIIKVVDEIETSSNKKNIKIKLNLENEKSMIKQVDKLKITRVIENIMTNALKYSQEKASVEISTYKLDDDKIKISIRDQGIGIRKEDIPFIFDMYYSGKDFKKDSTGLGLYISKEIIEKHDGQIWADSKVDKGSIFHIIL